MAYLRKINLSIKLSWIEVSANYDHAYSFLVIIDFCIF